MKALLYGFMRDWSLYEFCFQTNLFVEICTFFVLLFLATIALCF
uniref:Uncharacterized protein n=1 Tax=Rhizophora mucronata TaxID=61149 RepID=A0A2P2QZ51_RHIMU